MVGVTDVFQFLRFGFRLVQLVSLRQLVDNQKAKEAGVAQVHDMREAAAKRVPVSA